MKRYLAFAFLFSTITIFCEETSITPIEDEKEFEQLIKTSAQPVVAQFHSGCPVCNSTRQHLNKIVSEYPAITFVEVDINVLPNTTKKYNITALPTILIFEPHNEEPKHAIMGPDNKEILKLKIDETVASIK